MNKAEVAKLIREGLTKQAFADWYNEGRFDAYISNQTEDNAPTAADIEEDIIRLFRLK